MGRRKKQDDPAAPDVDESTQVEGVPEVDITIVTHDPAVFICVGSAYVEHEAAATKERRVNIDDKNYEHVGEDIDGVWCYRRM